MRALYRAEVTDYAVHVSSPSVPSGPRNQCPLTARELEILANVACGYSNRRIADHYSLSEQTVKNHLTNIMNRLNVPDRTAAVVLALRYGWLNLEAMEVVRREPSSRTA